MAQERAHKTEPRSILALEPGEELDEIMEQGFPIYQNGVEIDRYYPRRQPRVDPDTLSERARRILALAGAVKGLNWEETEADLERIDRESKPTPPIEFDW